MKADKHEIEMRCREDLELCRDLEKIKIKFVAVEFGTIDNLGDSQFR